MKRFILFLLVLVIAGAASVVLVNEQGYFMVVYGDKLIKMPLWLGVCAGVALILVIWFVLAVLKTILKIPGRWSQGFTRRKRKKALENLKESIHLIAINDWRLLEKNNENRSTLNALRMSEESEILKLKAAYELGNYDLIVKAYAKSNDKFIHNEICGWLYAKALIAEQKYQEAELILLKTAKRSKQPSVIYEALANLYIKVQDYVSLNELLPKMSKMHLVQKSYNDYLSVCYIGLLNNARKISQLSFNDVWESIPRKIKKQHKVVDAYIHGLYSLKEHGKASTLLKKLMLDVWDDVLFEIYATNPHRSDEQAFTLMNTWISKHSPKLTHRQLHLYARAAIAAKDFAKAEEALNRILSEKACARTYMLLSEVCAEKSMHTLAAEYEKKALDTLKG
jgi:HemY protein